MKLTKFDELYNRFLFQWSQGNGLSNIIDKIKLNSTSQPFEQTEIKSLPEQQSYQYNDEQEEYKIEPETNYNTDKVKDVFYQIFPSFLLHQCQNKFPLEDNAIIPNNIIDNFWEQYSNIILQKLSAMLLTNITQNLLEILIDIFGSESTYNDKIFNESAMELVKLNIL